MIYIPRPGYKNKWTLRREDLEAEEEAERQSKVKLSLPRLKFLERKEDD